MRIKLSEVVGVGFPPDEGKALAIHLIEGFMHWGNLIIDAREAPPALLISGFYNGFWTEVFDRRPDLLSAALELDWDFNFPWQNDLYETAKRIFNRPPEKPA